MTNSYDLVNLLSFVVEPSDMNEYGEQSFLAYSLSYRDVLVVSDTEHDALYELKNVLTAHMVQELSI